MKKSTKGYLFEKDIYGRYVLTHQTTIYPCELLRIIGKRNVKGRRVDFEEIEILDRSDKRYRCLIKRKDLTISDLFMLIEFHEHGDRSIQSHPYTEDILDPTILDDFGIEVLTYKHYYSGNRKLCDSYYPVPKENVTSELKDKLEQWSKDAIAWRDYDENERLKRRSLPGLEWDKIERRTA